MVVTYSGFFAKWYVRVPVEHFQNLWNIFFSFFWFFLWNMQFSHKLKTRFGTWGWQSYVCRRWGKL